MTSSRSSVLTMLQSRAAKEKVINILPQPFIRQVTPYNTEDFDDEVKNAVNADMFLHTGLKICKVIVLGDVATGKTCLVNRFCYKRFDANYKATIGVDFEVERFDVLGIPLNLQIWDTAGQERFKCIAASYYRGAHAILIIFDVTNVVTLAHTAQWLEEAKEANPHTMPLVFLVATKRDMLSEGAFNQIEAQAKWVANGLGAEYWAVSSKTGDNIDSLFLRIAALTFNKLVIEEIRCGKRKMSQHSTICIGRRLDDTFEISGRHKCRNGCSK